MKDRNLTHWLPRQKGRIFRRFLTFLTMPILLARCSTYYPRAVTTQHPTALEGDLRRSVEALSRDIGERNCFRPAQLTAAASWIEGEFQRLGYEVHREPVQVDERKFGCQAVQTHNLIAELKGAEHPDDILVIGAHYDSKVATPGWHDHYPPLPQNPGTPGANDNASGIAALLALADQLRTTGHSRTVRFVAFTNEEPPFFQDPLAMGSWVHAQGCTARQEKIVGAIVLDALATFSTQPTTKRAKLAFLPSLVSLSKRTDYIAFLSNVRSRSFVRASASRFAKHSSVDLRTAVFPALTRRVAWSDDWSFWQEGYPAFTVTDTAYLRSDRYHELTDTAESLDYERFAAAVSSLARMIGGMITIERRHACLLD